MNSSNPFVSVVIPTFNRKDFLQTAVGSVLRQTDPDFELIIIDDGSDDGTEDRISQFEDKRIRYYYQENRGPAHARNRGVEKARGTFVAFLDSDDHWLPQKLERAGTFIQDYPDIKIFHTEELWYRQGVLLNQKKKHQKPDGDVYAQALPLCCISISTVLIHRTIFEDVGLFDEDLPACEDYDFWLRVTCRYPVKLIPEYLTKKDGGRPDQVSSKIWGLDRFRIRALDKILSAGSLNEKQKTLTLDQLENKCRIFAQGAEKRGRPEDAAFYRQLIEKYKKI